MCWRFQMHLKRLFGTKHSACPCDEHTSVLNDDSNQKEDEQSGKHSSSERRQKWTVKKREGAMDRDRDSRGRESDMVMMLL